MLPPAAGEGLTTAPQVATLDTNRRRRRRGRRTLPNCFKKPSTGALNIIEDNDGHVESLYQEVHRVQRASPEYRATRERWRRLQTGEEVADTTWRRTLRDEYTVEDDLIWYTKDGAHALVVPLELWPRVIYEYQDSPLAAHPGRDETLRAARQFYYWPAMARHIKTHVRHCLICATGRVVKDFVKCAVWNRFLRSNNVLWYFSPVYHQRANPVERRNQEIKKALRVHLLDQPPAHWDERLDEITHALNNRRNAATGQGPSQLLLGMTLTAPGNQGHPNVLRPPRNDPQARADRVRRALIHQQHYQEEIFPAPREAPVHFQVGQRVLTKTLAKIAGTIKPPWEGPYTVTAVLGDGVYEVRRAGNASMSTTSGRHQDLPQTRDRTRTSWRGLRPWTTPRHPQHPEDEEQPEDGLEPVVLPHHDPEDEEQSEDGLEAEAPPHHDSYNEEPQPAARHAQDECSNSSRHQDIHVAEGKSQYAALPAASTLNVSEVLVEDCAEDEDDDLQRMPRNAPLQGVPIVGL
ncbi:hypothetical protein NQ318_007489 [Aromia moschata]|uniref:RNA-directed DNA polymerase n=1 Tax=Aromia moschata TaxID=1265417 RepID=A0AAV8YEU8_9CUCU|nr:hypothetical protein NQ318_007489 [Aromia moschata]